MRRALAATDPVPQPVRTLAAPLTACPNVCVLADPKRLKTARRGDLVNGKRRLALVSCVVLACCKTPAQPESQPPATAPASDADGPASPGVAQQPVDHEDLPRRVCMRYAELAKDDPLLSAVLRKEAQDLERCIVEAAKFRAQEPEAYERYAACVMEHASLDDVRACQMAVYAAERGPGVPTEARVPAESAAAARRICERVVEFNHGDLLDSAPDTLIETSIEECLLDLPGLLGGNPENYERALECSEDADTIWEFAECLA